MRTNSKLADFGRAVLNVLEERGPDALDRLSDIVTHAERLGLGRQNDDAEDTDDPWLVPIDDVPLGAEENTVARIPLSHLPDGRTVFKGTAFLERKVLEEFPNCAFCGLTGPNRAPYTIEGEWSSKPGKACCFLCRER